MNKYLYLLLPVLFLAAACGKESPLPENQEEEGKTYKVTLKFGGEITAEDSPLTRTDASDMLMGICIWKGTSYFGGGLFDTMDNITVNLLAGSQYKFKCTMIKNGKQLFRSYSNTLNECYYSFPNYYNYTYLKNSIYYHDISPTDYTGYQMNNTIDIASAYISSDRYYGEVMNYTPVENGTIDIDLKHTVVGVKYKISGLTDGTLALTVKRGSDTFINETSISENKESAGALFECSDIYSAWLYPENYKETATVSLTWTRGIGVVQDLGSVNIDLLRNRMNAIRISLGADDGDATLGITTEDSPMGNESITIPLAL